MNENLMMAILAMDSYNRGYGSSIDFGINPDLANIGIGTAQTFITSTVLGQGVDQSASFYAISYIYNGQVIVSYRGTDNYVLDPLYGYPVAVGDPDAPEAQMAFQFYQDVAAKTSDQITLTGHSLGGGLAGLVADVYGISAAVFAPMAFTGAVGTVYNDVNTGLDNQLTSLIYNGNTSPPPPNDSGITSTEIQYQILAGVGGETSLHLNQTTVLDLGDGVSTTSITPLERHSMSTTVIRMFADDGTDASGNSEATNTSWRNAAQYFWPVMYNDSFAQQIGMTLSGTDATNKVYSDILRQVIAYSAINEGVEVFGDTGIRAFYHDADALGAAVNIVDNNGNNSFASADLLANATDISESLVQFAGDLALNKVSTLNGTANASTAVNGILNYNSAQNTLSVNFSQSLWTTAGGGAAQPGMIGEANLFENVLSNTSQATAIRNDMQTLYGSSDASAVVNQMVFSTTDSMHTVTLTDNTNDSANGEANRALLYVGGTGDSGQYSENVIKASSGNDIIIGGGDKNSDTQYYIAGTGNDIIVGGKGFNSVDYSGLATGNMNINLTSVGVNNFGSSGVVTKSNGNVDDLFNIIQVIANHGNDTIAANNLNIILQDSSSDILAGMNNNIACGSNDTITIADSYVATNGSTVTVGSYGTFYAKDSGANLFSDVIMLNGKSIAGNDILSGAEDNPNGVTYTYNSASDSLSILGAGASYRINNFRNGDFGIHLEDLGFTQLHQYLYATDGPLIPTGVDDNGNIFGVYASYTSDSWRVYTMNALGDFYDLKALPAGIDPYSGYIYVNNIANGTSNTLNWFSDTIQVGGYYVPLNPVNINNSGNVVGNYETQDGVSHGFVYSAGQVTTINDPKASNGTYVTSISSMGIVAGYYIDSSGIAHGFVDNGGVFTTIDAPNEVTSNYTITGTYITGVNDLGETVGYYDIKDNYGSSYSEAFTYNPQVFTALISESNSPVAVADNANAAITGSGNTANIGTGASVVVSGNNTIMNGNTGDSITENSNSNQTYVASYSTVNINGGTKNITNITGSNVIAGDDATSGGNTFNIENTSFGDTVTLAGNGDVVSDGASNNTIVMAANNETVTGGIEDVFVVGANTASNVINNFNSTDILSFSDPTASMQNLTAMRVGNDLVVSAGDPSTVTLAGFFDNFTGNSGNINISFAGSSSTTDAFSHARTMTVDALGQISISDTIVGTSANDVLFGGAENDTFIGSPGNDTIYGRQGVTNTVDYSNLATSVQLSVDNNFGGGLYGGAIKYSYNGGVAFDELLNIQNYLLPDNSSNTFSLYLNNSAPDGIHVDGGYGGYNKLVVKDAYYDQMTGTLYDTTSAHNLTSLSNYTNFQALQVDGSTINVDLTKSENFTPTSISAIPTAALGIYTSTYWGYNNTYDYSSDANAITLDTTSGIADVQTGITGIEDYIMPTSGTYDTTTVQGTSHGDTYILNGYVPVNIIGGGGNDIVTDSLAEGINFSYTYTGGHITMSITDGNQPIIKLAPGITMADITDPDNAQLTQAVINIAGKGSIDLTDTAPGGTLAGLKLQFSDGESAIVTANGLLDTSSPPTTALETINAAYSGDVSGNVLTDDSDPYGLQLSALPQTITTANGGTVTISANGQFTYTALLGFRGNDSFTYTAKDTNGASAVGTVDINNVFTDRAPVAVAGSFTAAYGQTITGNVLANDYDPDNDPMHVVQSTVTTADGFTIDLNPNGSFSYTPEAGFLGTDSFTYTVADPYGLTSSATVTLDVTAPPNSIVGTAGDDTLTGTAQDNILFGLDGNDTLIGGSTADTMYGGKGNDTYIVNNVNDVIVENPGEGTDSVFSSVSYTLPANVENITLTGHHNINATGNTESNIITGNSGNNILNDGGAGGADTLIGGGGNDTFIVNNSGDKIIEAPHSGFEKVLSSVSYTLPANVQELQLTGTANINATGNGQGSILIGNSGDNILNDGGPLKTSHGRDDCGDEGTGRNIMIGGAGNDTYIVNNKNDIIIEKKNGGTDTVISSVSWKLGQNLENLTLSGTANINATGNNENNVIIGNSGNNIINGGGGNNTLTGGGGADTFVMQASEAYHGIDTITDFSVQQGDNLEITGIRDFHSFEDHGHNNDCYNSHHATLADYVRITTSGNNSIVSVDANGRGNDFTQIAVLQNVTNLSASALVNSGNLLLQ